MKSNRFLLALLALTVSTGLAFTACKGGENSGNGSSGNGDSSVVTPTDGITLNKNAKRKNVITQFILSLMVVVQHQLQVFILQTNLWKN